MNFMSKWWLLLEECIEGGALVDPTLPPNSTEVRRKFGAPTHCVQCDEITRNSFRAHNLRRLKIFLRQ
jgi:hypothetical protein